MRVKQHVWFIIYSTVQTPDEITAVLGVEPDEAVAMGSRFTGGGAIEPHIKRPARKPVPPSHRVRFATASRLAPQWTESVPSLEPGLTEQIVEMVDRLEPAVDRIQAVVARGAWTRLHIGRHFNPDATEADTRFSIAPRELGFLQAVGAVIEVDEYDYSSEPEPSF
jgi:hypothetical protein